MPDDHRMSLTAASGLIPFTLVGGPTAIIDYAGFRIVTDPTFDEPMTYGPPKTGTANTLVKTRGSALSPEDVGDVDIVLASHHHLDNLDEAGRRFAATVPRLYSTAVVAKLLPNTEVLVDWERRTIVSPSGRRVTITAVPAQHGPDGLWQRLGPVIGFVLECDGEKTIYISGDNSSVDVVRVIAARFPAIDVAVLFAGGPCFEIYGGEYITFSDATAVEAGLVMPSATIVPIHADSWAHFTQTTTTMKDLADERGIGHRVVALSPGESALL